MIEKEISHKNGNKYKKLIKNDDFLMKKILKLIFLWYCYWLDAGLLRHSEQIVNELSESLWLIAENISIRKGAKPLRVITINFKFGAICTKRSKAQNKIIKHKRRWKNNVEKNQCWNRNYSAYRSISHIKWIFKWLLSLFDPKRIKWKYLGSIFSFCFPKLALHAFTLFTTQVLELINQ